MNANVNTVMQIGKARLTLGAEGGVDGRAVPGLYSAVHAGDGGGVNV